MTVFLFFVVLAVLVLVHELGHFLVAKWSGVRVDEFGLGFPPRLWSKKIGETSYSINMIPFGGFVKIFGENPNDDSISGPDSTRSFVNKKRPIQLAVLVAGIVFNVIFAWLLYSLVFMTSAPTIVTPENAARVRNAHVTVINVFSESPAQKAGLKPGDQILGVRTGADKIESTELDPETMGKFIAGHPEELTLDFKRGSSPTQTIAITAVSGIAKDQVAIGISMDMIGVMRLNPASALFEGAKVTVRLSGAIAGGIYSFLRDTFSGQAHWSQVGGPVAIAGYVGDARALGIVYLLQFTALISINLALLNLIPFPALDGGRMLFVIIEAIRRKSINPKIANTTNAIGFAVLLALMVVVTYKDVLKLF